MSVFVTLVSAIIYRNPMTLKVFLAEQFPLRAFDSYSFVMTTPGGEEVSGVLSLDRLGAKGMFIGMIAAFIAGEIYCRITKRGWQIKMPDGVPPAVSKIFCCFDSSRCDINCFLSYQRDYDWCLPCKSS